MTSQHPTSLRKISLPFSCLVLIVMLRLLQLSIVKYKLSRPGLSRNCPRVISPRPGSSTLMTSAPNHANICVHVAPDCTCVISRIRTPSSAFPIDYESPLKKKSHSPRRREGQKSFQEFKLRTSCSSCLRGEKSLHLYIVCALVPGAYSLMSTQMLTIAHCPPATRSRAFSN